MNRNHHDLQLKKAACVPFPKDTLSLLEIRKSLQCKKNAKCLRYTLKIPIVNYIVQLRFLSKKT